MENDTIINYQIALAKRIIHKTGNGNFPIEFQLSIYDQINRDIRMNTINNNKNGNNTRPATAKQKQLMDSLGIEYKENIDIRKASELIKDTIKKL